MCDQMVSYTEITVLCILIVGMMVYTLISRVPCLHPPEMTYGYIYAGWLEWNMDAWPDVM